MRAEIRRLAAELGNPPGRARYEKETGTRTSEWHGKIYRSWGDALQDAGFEARQKQAKLSSEEVIRKFAEAARHFNRIPADVDLRMYARENKGFPGHTTFANHFADKHGVLKAFADLVFNDPSYSDLKELVQASETSEPLHSSTRVGLVYLLKSGAYFKIGRSDNLERRVKQVAVAMPDAIELVHSIRTDDPSGIEAYWHNRFSDKRANGEWFRLLPADVRIFKKRRFM